VSKLPASDCDAALLAPWAVDAAEELDAVELLDAVPDVPMPTCERAVEAEVPSCESAEEIVFVVMVRPHPIAAHTRMSIPLPRPARV